MTIRTADKLLAEQRESELAARPTLDALYVRYFDFVWRSLRRLGVHPAVVEDAAQDVFVVLYRRLDSLRADASPKAFLFAIAMRVASDYRRTAKRKGATSLNDLDLVSGSATPFETAARAEAVALLERFLHSLDDDRRVVFVMMELEGMTAPEVSDALRANLSTVYTRLRSARQRFVAFLEEARHG